MKQKAYCTLLGFLCLCLTGCGSLDQTISNIDALSVITTSLVDDVRPHKTKEGEFPRDGYDLKLLAILSGVRDVQECSLQRFEDNDSLYYIKFSTSREKKGCFYFNILNAHQEQIFIQNVLDKKVDKRYRIKWLAYYMEQTGVNFLDWQYEGNQYWVYWKRHPVFTSQYPDAKVTLNGMGELPFNTKYMKLAFQEQYNRSHQWIQIGAAWLLLKKYGYRSNGKYYCNDRVFDNEGDMLDYKNANGL